VNGTLRVTIPPGAGWDWARGPKAIVKMRTLGLPMCLLAFGVLTYIVCLTERSYVSRC
jgi:hypothetical protein